jgi:predicted nucleic acid-binding protein
MFYTLDVFADTNVLLRRLQPAHAHNPLARLAIRKLRLQGNRICVCSQNFFEVWAVATRPVNYNGLGLTPAEADLALLRLQNSVFRLPDSDDVFAEWRRLVVLHEVCGKTTHDARLVAAMNVYRITHILTFDVADFTRFPNLTILHPASV